MKRALVGIFTVAALALTGCTANDFLNYADSEAAFSAAWDVVWKSSLITAGIAVKCAIIGGAMANEHPHRSTKSVAGTAVVSGLFSALVLGPFIYGEFKDEKAMELIQCQPYKVQLAARP